MADFKTCDFFIKLYFDLWMIYKDISFILAVRHGISVSLRQIKRRLASMNLRRRRYSNLLDVVEFIKEEINGSRLLHGYHIMFAKCKDRGLQVRKEHVRLIMEVIDPEGVENRSSRCLVRRAYFSRGPNFIWHLDGYDKLKPFGLCISGCIDGYSRRIIWLNVNNTNNNPRIIGGYFLEAVKENRGCPRMVRGDFGTENGHVRAFQRFFHRHSGFINVYLDGTSTANQRIESWWGFLRRECIHFWIVLFRCMEEQGLYSGDFLDKNLIQLSFMALIQDELDDIAEIWNTHTIRRSTNEHVPSGRPDLMYFTPILWGSENYLCQVSREEIDACTAETEFRSAIPSDMDFYNLCIATIRRQRIDYPKDAKTALNMYKFLRHEITTYL